MTNTKFRKRALLSSVAMLLVALVALGSATFAWFAANPDASASGISLRTTASDGLVIRTDSDSTWSHDAKLYNGIIPTAAAMEAAGETIKDYAFNLAPVSQSQTSGSAGTFYKVQAAGASSSEYKAKIGETPSTVTAATFSNASTVPTGDVYSEKIYFRLSDGAGSTTKKVYLESIDITGATGNSTALKGAIRVSVANKNGVLLGTYGISAPTNKCLNSTSAIVDSYTTVDFSPAAEAKGSSKHVEVTGISNLTASGTDLANYVTVYVWLDGEDANCYSEAVGTVNATEIISGISLGFTLA